MSHKLTELRFHVLFLAYAGVKPSLATPVFVGELAAPTFRRNRKPEEVSGLSLVIPKEIRHSGLMHLSIVRRTTYAPGMDESRWYLA